MSDDGSLVVGNSLPQLFYPLVLLTAVLVPLIAPLDGGVRAGLGALTQPCRHHTHVDIWVSALGVFRIFGNLPHRFGKRVQ